MALRERVCALLMVVLLSTPALAEEFRAMCRELPEVSTMELEPGEKGILTIYLKSSGDPVDNYTIQLFKVPYRRDSLPIAEMKSDKHGIIIFKDLEAGSYHFQMKDDGKPRLTVDVGDMRLEKH